MKSDSIKSILSDMIKNLKKIIFTKIGSHYEVLVMRIAIESLY